MEKIKSIQEAVNLIKDNDTIVINGMGWIANPVEFYRALEKRFLESGHPRDITLLSSCGIGGREHFELANRLSHPGLVKKIIAGHWDSYRAFHKRITNNEIEAYNPPQGVVSLLLHAATRRVPGILSKIGLKTMIDPRQTGGALNSISKEEIVSLTKIGGEEYLFYKTIFPDIAVIRGTTADPRGNITFEKEALVLDPLVTAQAAKNNGGKVIVQVERVTDRAANPMHVKIPGQLVDAIYLAPNQKQTQFDQYNPLFSGEIRAPKFLLAEQQKLALQIANDKTKAKRGASARVIARRAALEIKEDDFINIGIGIPTMIGLEAVTMGIASDKLVFTVESGSMGGIPAFDYSFGACINADAIYDQTAQFEFYEGGGLDITFIGALEIDAHGNVNSTRIDDKIFGLGGFNFVTQTPKKVVICSKFQQGSDLIIDGDVIRAVNGSKNKFVKNVQCISLSAEYAREEAQEIIYITERAVFKLGANGLEMTEVLPGLDIQKDILNYMPFRPIISKDLKTYNPICYQI